MNHINLAAKLIAKGLAGSCLVVLGFQGVGCNIFGGDSDNREEAGDICEEAEAFSRFVTQHPVSGLGVTSAQCAASARGQWIEGRCYCHTSEG